MRNTRKGDGAGKARNLKFEDLRKEARWAAGAERRRAWGRRLRRRLLGELGRRCVFCGTVSKLTLDCVQPRQGHCRQRDHVGRSIFYRAQMEAGNLQVLCRHCNSVKSDRADYRPPFVAERGRVDG